MNAQQTIEFARKYPFDDRAPTDAAHLAALAVLADLSDRSGISAQLESLGDDIRTEIVDTLAEIIRLVINDGKEVCEDCNGTGVQCFGTSGLAEDGNAPELEPCGTCGYGPE